jgi:hypothetical protein
MILPFVTLSWLLPSRYHLYLRSRSST